MEPRVKIIGCGMNCGGSMTVDGRNAVENADLLIGAGRILDGFEHIDSEKFRSYDTAKIADRICAEADKKVAVLMSGDCGFFSGAQKLSAELQKRNVPFDIIPSIASPVYLCSKLGLSWDRLRFVSLHGAKANIVREVCSNEYVFALIGSENDCGNICRKLTEYGRENVKVIIGENMGYADEKLTEDTAEKLGDIVTSKLSSMIIINRDFEKTVRSGISDDEFIRGKAPMTKAEIRCQAISKLDIGRNDICWDIGSGTGSVSVEMALRCPEGCVYAVEKDAEAAELSERNFRKFGCDNITQLYGRAEELANGLPAPDCVFIGGSGGGLSEIVSAAVQKNPSVRIVMTAVTLETLRDSECLGEREIVQISAARAVKAGNYHMLRGENPVFIIGRVIN